MKDSFDKKESCQLKSIIFIILLILYIYKITFKHNFPQKEWHDKKSINIYYSIYFSLFYIISNFKNRRFSLSLLINILCYFKWINHFIQQRHKQEINIYNCTQLSVLHVLPKGVQDPKQLESNKNILTRNSLQSCLALQKIHNHMVHSQAVPTVLWTRLTWGGTNSLLVEESRLVTAASN